MVLHIYISLEKQFYKVSVPNIVGSFDGNTNDGNPKTGAFYTASYNSSYADGAKGGGIIGFNAHLSNSIYGASSYVQPKSVSVIPLLKY